MATSGVCPFVLTRKLVLHALLSLLLLFVQALQGIILDTFLISANPHGRGPYFWLISDLFIMFLFGITMCKSYSYWKKSTGSNIGVKSNAKLAESRRKPSFFIKYKSLFGYHPLCYLSWFVYSVVLVVKIAFIFKMGIINDIDDDSYLGPQLMKVCLGLTAIVFFLFVEGHYDAARNSTQALYIANLIKGTSFEIFDSIAFLSLLHVSETKMMFSYTFENVIIGFACITILLPNVCFYKLSQNDYGCYPTKSILTFIYKMLHLFLVNIPYMVVRIYLWVMMDVDVSIFLVKNVLHIILAVLDCNPEFLVMLKTYRQKGLNNATPAASAMNNHSCPSSIDPNTCKVTITEEDSFVEIDLKVHSNVVNEKEYNSHDNQAVEPSSV